MKIFTTRVKTNLNGVLQMTQMVDGIMMTGDNAANQIIVELYSDFDKVQIAQGTKIVGYFIRSDGYTIETDGSVNEAGEAVVIIPEVAYQVSGTLSIAIRMFDDEQTATYRGYYKTVVKRGYYDSTSETNAFVEVTDESVVEGPNGEEVKEYIFTANEFIQVTDESITEGPNAEPIVTKTFESWGTKVVIATLSCFVRITESDSLIDVYHHIPDVQELLAYIEDLDIRKEQMRLAEESREAAELAREKAEKGPNLDGQGGRVKAEADRVVSENARVQAEAARVQSETTRDTAETARTQAENARDQAETLRNQNESARSTAEAERVAAEALRVQAENARDQAETARDTAETARQTAETNRETAQAARNTMIDDMTVEVIRLANYSEPTIEISEVNGHKHIKIGLAPGDPFVIQKTFSSIAAMNAYTGTDVRNGQFVVIETGNVNDPDNSKMYLKTQDGYVFVSDLSGSQGFTGNGIASAELDPSTYKLTLNWTNGEHYTTPISIRGSTGNGIESASLDTNTYQLTLNYTDGNSYTTPISIRGATGNGIASAALDTNTYKLALTFTDGNTYTTPISIRGEVGPVPNITVGTVTTGAEGSRVSVTRRSGSTDENPVFDFEIPKGDHGDTGAIPNIIIGTVTSVSATEDPSVTRREGSPDTAPIFDFEIPKGEPGMGGADFNFNDQTKALTITYF